ncbi:MAG: ferric reductase-like transmembrane domain-containing protein [Gaiellaceae bacterium]
MTTTTELWYLTRGSGAVALLLLTAAVVLGILSSVGVRTDRWPRFAVGKAHRNLTLLSIVFVVLHVVTTVADGYAPIGLKDALVPFASPYRPVWLGLGAVAFDLLLALVVTSYLRHRIGFRVWRGVHWLAYVSWPVALVHSFGTGSDARASWLYLLGLGSLVSVTLAALVRAAATRAPGIPRLAAVVAAALVPIAVVAWYQQGPAKRGWAARAGTPGHLRASARLAGAVGHVQLASAPSPPHSFTSRLAGTIRNSQASDGRVSIVISLRLAGSPGGALRVDLRGNPTGGGVAMDASGVSFVPATTRAVYLGTVTALDGNAIGAQVRDAAGDRLNLTLVLSLDAGAARGTVQAVSIGEDSG